MKRLQALMILLMIIPAAAALDLDNYPDQFFMNQEFKGKIVVGKEAPSQDVASAIEMIPSLQAKSNKTIRASTLDSDVTDYIMLSNNIISMGTACDNTVTADIIGIQENCESYFEEGEGYIYLYESDTGKAWLVVAGGTPADTERAAMVLGNYQDYDLNGDAIIVTGETMPYTIEQTRLPTVIDEEPEEEEKEEAVVEVEESEPVEEKVSEKELEIKSKIERFTEEETEPELKVEEPKSEPKKNYDSTWDKVWDGFKNWLNWFFE